MEGINEEGHRAKQSNLRFLISGFEMQDLSDFKIFLTPRGPILALDVLYTRR
jgi:hypothetical protein